MNYIYGIGEMLDDSTYLVNNGREQITVKNNILEFKRVLNQSVDALWSCEYDFDELELIEWENENATFLDVLFTQRVFLEYESELLNSTLGYHIFNLIQLNKQLQVSVNDNDEKQVSDTVDLLTDYLFRVVEDLEEVLPKVKATIAIEKYGFAENEVDKLERLFKDV